MKVYSARLYSAHSYPNSKYAPIQLPPPGLDFEGAGVGILNNSKRPHSIDGKAEERLVMTNSTARADRLFRSRKAALFRPDLREIEESEVAGHRHQVDRGRSSLL